MALPVSANAVVDFGKCRCRFLQTPLSVSANAVVDFCKRRLRIARWLTPCRRQIALAAPACAR
jgi:hypothetical protein